MHKNLTNKKQETPELKAFVDATEQEIPRPKAKKKRKTHYSGKKKRHTIKTQLAVNVDGSIVTRHITLKVLCTTTLCLSAVERVVSEHTNSRVKKFLIWGREFRNRLKHYDVATEIVSGIVNFRITGTLTV